MTKVIGIDASRAFIKSRTGIEEYSYQVIKHLTDKLNGHQVILYLRKYQVVDFDLPSNWRIKIIKFPYLWTQLGLSLEMLFNPVDTLFIPAHTVPFIHPKNTIVTIHGLEYEFCFDSYSFWAKMYMRWSIKNSCQWAKTIIAVSNNTKKDLMKLYNVAEEKISVIYESFNNCHSERSEESRDNISSEIITGSFANTQDDNNKYLLFIGRLEERKNIVGIIRAFEILKEHYKILHKLILAGKFGYGAEKIKKELANVNCAKDIILTGFVSEEKKWDLLKKAEIFLFPTFYEGFGIPVLEAQSVGVPVVAGNNSSIPEIVNNCHPELDSGSNKITCLPAGRDSGSEARMTGDSAILVDPNNAEDIADATYKLISDKNLRDDIIKRGYENVKRFSWEKCADQIATLLNS